MTSFLTIDIKFPTASPAWRAIWGHAAGPAGSRPSSTCTAPLHAPQHPGLPRLRPGAHFTGPPVTWGRAGAPPDPDAGRPGPPTPPDDADPDQKAYVSIDGHQRSDVMPTGVVCRS